MTAVDILATNNFGDTREGGLVGPLGLLVIGVLAIVTVLLIRNMSKRIKRLPDTFEETPKAEAPADADADGPART